jgi:tellurite resistance protein TehA-like permease
MLWSWAVIWISYALLGLIHILRRAKIQFKLTAWGLVFPNVSA